MRKIIFILLPLAYVIMSGCGASRTMRTDAVDVADSANNARSGKPGYDKATSAFLVDAADARMMDIKEGRAAARKGSSPEIRNYGRLMVKDQTTLLTSIRKLAATQQIALPTDISNSKKEGFSQLAELDAGDFDKKFVKMITIDHERDVKEFTEAKSLTNSAVAAFATAKLPLILSHLDKINAIASSEKK